MGCRWTTVSGRRIRVGPVESPVSAGLIGSFGVASLMRGLDILHLVLSPAKTPEELEGAVLRLWLHPEQGYLVEARTSPEAPPVYHHIDPAEASLLEIHAPTAEFISRMLHYGEIPDH